MEVSIGKCTRKCQLLGCCVKYWLWKLTFHSLLAITSKALFDTVVNKTLYIYDAETYNMQAEVTLAWLTLQQKVPTPHQSLAYHTL